MVHSLHGLEFPASTSTKCCEMSEDELKKNACIIVDEAQFLTREEVSISSIWWTTAASP